MLLRRAAIRDDRLKPTAIHATLGNEEAKAMKQPLCGYANGNEKRAAEGRGYNRRCI
jgi:hypothetical protein